VCAYRSRRRLKKRAALFMASRGLPADQSSTHDGVNSEQTTYRRTGSRAGRDDRYPALLPGVDKAPSSASNTRNNFIGDDVEKLYDFTATAAVATDAGRRGGGVACQTVTDYSPAVERASSTVDVGRTLALFGADRLYQSATATLACPLCVHPGSTAWTREALYVERRPMTRRDHDVDCPLHADKSSFDVTRWQEHQQSELAVYPPGLRSPDQLMLADNCQPHEHSSSRSQ